MSICLFKNYLDTTQLLVISRIQIRIKISPYIPPDNISSDFFPGQEAIDLSVCLAILKKAIVAIPLLIMIILYLIRCNMTPENQTEPAATPNEAKNTIFESPNLNDSNSTQDLENEEMPRPSNLIQLIRRRKKSTEFSSKTSQNPWASRNLQHKFLSVVTQPTKNYHYGNGLSSFQAGDTRLYKFLPKNQRTQRKLLNFENCCSGEL